MCGTETQKATRKPAVQAQRKVKKVWQPKQVTPEDTEPVCSVPTEGVQTDISEPAVTPVVDGQVVNNPPTQDDGWRVVSRRRKIIRTPSQMLGLAQVQAVNRDFSFDENGEEGGERHLEPDI